MENFIFREVNIVSSYQKLIGRSKTYNRYIFGEIKHMLKTICKNNIYCGNAKEKATIKTPNFCTPLFNINWHYPI